MDKTIEGKVFFKNRLENLCIGIKDGKITEIKKILKSDCHQNFGNNLILPAGLDLHVHFRDPGFTYKEDFRTGSLSAAFGGISCVFDMPNTIPQTVTNNDLLDKISNARAKSYVDFGIYAGVTNNNLEEIKKLSKNCNGFKIYLGSSTNALAFNKTNLSNAVKEISKTKKPVLFHAEDQNLLDKNIIEEKGLDDHIKGRPSICEEAAIIHILNLCQNTNISAHICHLSSIEGLETVRYRSKNITCGVTPHHLLFNIEKNLSPPSFFKVNPPIRSNFDKEALFNAIKAGMIDTIESDHAPHTIEEKEKSFSDAPAGIPGVETMYPLFLYLVKKGILPLNRVVSAICKRPAEIINVPKGSIEVGNDADFIVVNIKESTLINPKNLHSKCSWTPFKNFKAIFPSHLYIRGEKIIEGNEMQVSQGFGRFIED